MLLAVVNVPATGSYSSGLARAAPLLSIPPATSTFPLPNSVAVWENLATFMLPVAVKVPAAGSYNSALAGNPPLLSSPPAMSTLPLGNNNVAV